MDFDLKSDNVYCETVIFILKIEMNQANFTNAFKMIHSLNFQSKPQINPFMKPKLCSFC